ncbi:MAG: phytase [Pirellulaceae bacterium]
MPAFSTTSFLASFSFVLFSLPHALGQDTLGAAGDASVQRENHSAITAKIETEAVKGDVDEDAADDPAFWLNGEDPEQSLVLGTDKKSGVNLYNLQGEKLRGYDVGSINNIDVRQGVLDFIDLVGASNRDTRAMNFWRVDPESLSLKKLGVISSKLPDIYGFCLGRNLETEEVYAFANSKTGRVEQWLLKYVDGSINGKLVRELQLPSQVEGMVVDDKLGRLYVGVEEAGIYRFGLGATASTEGELIGESTNSNPSIDYDIEGLTLYEQDEQHGYLIASIQGNNSYAVFARGGSNAYIASFEISDGTVDGVQETDGVQVVSHALGPDFPSGLFICQDGCNFDKGIKKSQNFKYVSWQQIAEQLNLQ